MSQYVSDLITLKDIELWNNGDLILIDAPTGKGKNRWVFDILSNHCESESKKVLLLSNRNALKEQNWIEIRSNDKNSTITAMNYQALENHIINGRDIPFYDYIVADECHYFFNDAMFNRKTDLAFEWLLERQSAIRIFMSATCYFIEGYLHYIGIELRKYDIKPDYDYINEIYYYNSDEVLRGMILQLPADEKLIYFASAEKAFNMSRELNDSSFICSQNNGVYANKSNGKEMKSIINQQKFESQILCTTCVLDNGINIADPQIRHIVVDYFDRDTIQQCVGRLRITEGQKINLYFRNRDKRSLNGTMDQVLKDVEKGDYLKESGQVAYLKRYYKQDSSSMVDFIMKDENVQLHLNKMMYWKHKQIITDCNELKKVDNGYIKSVIARFNRKIADIKFLDDHANRSILDQKLRELIGVPMYKPEQKELQSYLKHNLYNAPRSLGIKNIKAIIKKYELPYDLLTGREKSRLSENRDKTYWIVSAR